MQAGDGFVRVWTQHQGKRTSISLDDVMFAGLRKREGGHDEAMRWLRAAVLRVEELRQAGDPLVMVDKAGLSRLVQRLTMSHLLS